MNSKKIMAGLLSAAMVVTSFAVPTQAADYTALQKDLSKNGTVTEGTLTGADGKDTFATKWWDPNTFSNSLAITDKQVTIKFHAEGGNYAPYYFLFSSDTGAMYGGNTADASYDAGQKAHMLEYITVRGNMSAFAPTNGSLAETSWTTDGAIDNSNIEVGTYNPTLTAVGDVPWGEDEDGNILATAKYATSDDWKAAALKGCDGTITARKDGDYVVVNFDINYASTQLKMKYDKKRPVYIALIGDGPTFSKASFQYATVQKATLSLNKKSATYTGKKQEPGFTIKDTKGNDVSSKYDVSVSYNKASKSYKDTAFTNAGSYVIKAETKDPLYVGPLTATYEIKQASQSIKIGTKKANKTKVSVTYKGKKKIKKKKLAKKQTITIKLAGAKNSYSAKKQYQVSGGVQYAMVGKKLKKMVTCTFTKKNTLKITVKKGAPAMKYTVVVVAKNDTNYAQSAARTITINVKKK